MYRSEKRLPLACKCPWLWPWQAWRGLNNSHLSSHLSKAHSWHNLDPCKRPDRVISLPQYNLVSSTRHYTWKCFWAPCQRALKAWTKCLRSQELWLLKRQREDFLKRISKDLLEKILKPIHYRHAYRHSKSISTFSQPKRDIPVDSLQVSNPKETYLPCPVSSISPVPGKKSPPNLWKLTVITRSVW